MPLAQPTDNPQAKRCVILALVVAGLVYVVIGVAPMEGVHVQSGAEMSRVVKGLKSVFVRDLANHVQPTLASFDAGRVRGSQCDLRFWGLASSARQYSPSADSVGIMNNFGPCDVVNTVGEVLVPYGRSREYGSGCDNGHIYSRSVPAVFKKNFISNLVGIFDVRDSSRPNPRPLLNKESKLRLLISSFGFSVERNDRGTGETARMDKIVFRDLCVAPEKRCVVDANRRLHSQLCCWCNGDVTTAIRGRCRLVREHHLRFHARVVVVLSIDITENLEG